MINGKKARFNVCRIVFWTTLKFSLWSLQLRLYICINRWSIRMLRPIIAVTFKWSLILFNSSLLSTYSLHLLEVFWNILLLWLFSTVSHLHLLTFSATVFLYILFLSGILIVMKYISQKYVLTFQTFTIWKQTSDQE